MQFLYNNVRLIAINLVRQRDMKINIGLFGQLVITDFHCTLRGFRKTSATNDKYRYRRLDNP